jgi:hypothetical protein
LVTIQLKGRQGRRQYAVPYSHIPEPADIPPRLATYQRPDGERREIEYGETFFIPCPHCGAPGLRRAKRQSGGADTVTLWCPRCPRYVTIVFGRYGALIGWHRDFGMKSAVVDDCGTPPPGRPAA